MREQGSPAPPPPYDAVLKTLLRRRVGRLGLKIILTAQPEPVYFHLDTKCLNNEGLFLCQDNIFIENQDCYKINAQRIECFYLIAD